MNIHFISVLKCMCLLPPNLCAALSSYVYTMYDIPRTKEAEAMAKLAEAAAAGEGAVAAAAAAADEKVCRCTREYTQKKTILSFIDFLLLSHFLSFHLGSPCTDVAEKA